jgi:hypothetical protein
MLLNPYRAVSPASFFTSDMEAKVGFWFVRFMGVYDYPKNEGCFSSKGEGC